MCSITQQIFFKIPRMNYISEGTNKWRNYLSTSCDHTEIIICFATTFPHYNFITFRAF